jgi:ADP-heptose:LPS heptosyltransferase
MTKGFSIIIPTYNTLLYLKLFLKSLADNSSFEHQIIVCDDGSRDGTAEFLKNSPGIDAVLCPVNQGICTATNLAAAKASRDLMFIANDDLVAAPGWDTALIGRFAPGRVLSAVQVEPGWVPVAGCHLERDFGRTHDQFRKDDFTGFAKETAAAHQGIARPGVNYPFLLESRLWEALGGLDQRFNPGPGSDPDLFYRLALRRAEMLQVRDSLFYHFGGRSSRFAGEIPGQSSRWKQAARDSRKIFASKWGGPWEFGFGEVPKVRRPGSVLMLVYGGIGNMVMALPALQAVRKALPPGSLSLAVQKRQMLELVQPDDFADAVSLDQPQYQGLKGLSRLVSRLRAQKPEAALACVPFPRRKYGLLALSAGATKRVCELTLFTLGCNTAIKTSARHFLERNLELLRGFGLEEKFAGFDIPLNGRHEQWARDFLERKNLSGKSLAGIHPGAGHPCKRWPAESFIELGRQLASRGWELLIFGGPEESELTVRVAAGIGEQARVFPGTEGLGRTLALIRHCRKFVSNDSGLAHCAAALGAETLAIFGPTDPEVCRPYGVGVRVVTSGSKCRPCYQPGGKYRCSAEKKPCLNEITVEMVLEAFR